MYSLNQDQIINDDGQIPETAVEVDPSTIVEGSLDPLQPFVRHSVNVNLVRDGSAMYFTINSKSTLVCWLTRAIYIHIYFFLMNLTILLLFICEFRV